MWEKILKNKSLNHYLDSNKWEGEYESKIISWPEAKRRINVIINNVPKEHRDFLIRKETTLLEDIKRNKESYSEGWKELMDMKINRLFSDSLSHAKELKNKYAGKTAEESKNVDLLGMSERILGEWR